MEITEDEAREIYGSIRCAEFEQGEPDEENPLITRIRKEFPNIDREIEEKKLKEHLWGDVAEEDPRVIEARRKMNDTPMFLKGIGKGSNPEYYRMQKEFFRIKGEVFRELMDNHGFPTRKAPET